MWNVKYNIHDKVFNGEIIGLIFNLDKISLSHEKNWKIYKNKNIITFSCVMKAIKSIRIEKRIIDLELRKFFLLKFLNRSSRIFLFDFDCFCSNRE